MQRRHELPQHGRLLIVADEISALGYRLSGVTVVVPDPDQVEAVLDEALVGAALVLITSGLTKQLSARRLALLERSLVPSLLVVPDLQGRHPMPDTGARVRAELAADT